MRSLPGPNKKLLSLEADKIMTSQRQVDAIVAGHICLDIIPDLSAGAPGQFDNAFQPGRLVQVGPATVTGGGVVYNTGLALHRLGIKTRLIAQVGDDPFGQALRQCIRAYGTGIDENIVSNPDSSTSYSIVITPPGSDRRFLHHPGANDDFSDKDVSQEDLLEARLFHFGYPPLMARMYARDGERLLELFRRVKTNGLITSLDMAYPDPESAAGQADWWAVLQKVLPYVDIFVPSLEEIQFMLWRKMEFTLSAELLRETSDELLGMGAKMVLLKLGDRGLYLRTAGLSTCRNLDFILPSNLDAWVDFEAWLPCFKVEVVGTTGAGDVTVAGFLAALLKGLSPGDALTTALAVGACCVEATDALSGLRSWNDTWQRIHLGWASLPEPEQFRAKLGSEQ
jgi:sugar/nucleoside kinase (ribokinase family)